MASLSQRYFETGPTVPVLPKMPELEKNINQYQPKGENNMSKLRTLNLTLVDNHPDLKAAEKIVFQQLNYVTEHTNDQTIQQVLMTGDVESALAKHNKKRESVVDRQILRNTGRDVFLEPVEIWDLEWIVIQSA